MAERKLATIRRIKQILPIAGADKIEIALVDGWQVVVKKGEFTEGQLAVYFEIDSFVPNTVAPFLTKEGYEPKEYNGIKGERLKTIKLRKTLSQGLLLPLSVVPDYERIPAESRGMDVTEALGVQKWEAPEEKAANNGAATGAKNRPFPYYIRKTDQERVQNFGRMVEQSLDTEFEFSLKKDGSSLTVFKVMPDSPYYKDAKARDNKELSFGQRFLNFFKKAEPVYGICSRNLQLKLEGSTNFHKGAAKVLDELNYFKGSVAVQLELVAPDIQGNYEKVDDVEVHCFDVFSIDRQEYMLPKQRQDFCRQLSIPHVTILAEGTLRDVVGYKPGDDIVAKCLDYAEGPSDNAGVKREGFVAKAMDRDFSFKAVSNSYLIATGK
jgi:RNA ligase (TIGR02306 family)